MNTQETATPEVSTAPKRTGISPVEVAMFGLRVHRNRWKLFIVPLVVGVFLAVGAAFLLGKQTWEATGTMIYTAPPVPEAQRGLYVPPDQNTLLALAKSPDVLAGVRDEFQLQVPDSLLDKLFKVTSPRNTQVVNVSFSWAEPDKAAAMTNRLMERFIALVREQRQRKMDAYLADYDARIKDCDDRNARAVASYHQYLGNHNLFDLAADTESIRKELESLQTVRSNALREEVATTAQRDRVAQEVANIKRKDLEAAASDKQFEAALESVADNRRRQDRLRELIEEDKKRTELLAELTNKRKDYERLSLLRDRGATGQAEVDAVSKEIDILTAKLNDSEEVKRWKAELTKIDEAVVPKGPSKNQGSPIIHQTLFRQLELDLKLIALQKELFEAEKGISVLRRRQAELQSAMRQSDGLQKEITAASTDRQTLADQKALFVRLRDQQSGEFAIVTPGRASSYPVSSNRKLFLLGGLALAFAVALGRGGLAEWRASYHHGRSTAARAGLESLGELSHESEEDLSLATMKLRDWLPSYGATALILGDGHVDPYEVALQLGRKLCARDERVLIVDCRIGPFAVSEPLHTEGLGDYLHYHSDDEREYLVPDEAAGVEVLPAGQSSTLDVLASRRMSRMLSQARERYSFVLLVGPDVQRSYGIELLRRHSDGVIPVISTLARRGIADLVPLTNDSTKSARCLVMKIDHE